MQLSLTLESKMKALNLFVHLLVVFKPADAQALASLAINSILNNHFANDEPKVDVIYFGKKGGTSETMMDEILKYKSNSVSVKVSKGGKEYPWMSQLNVSSITIFDSPKIFKETVQDIKWLSNPQRRHKHLVYAPKLTAKDIIENIADGFSIDNVNFLLNETEKSIKLVSSFMFTSSKCHTNQLVTINRFISNTKSWEGWRFFPQKYQNLHGCRLTVGTDSRSSISQSFITMAENYNFIMEIKHVEKTIGNESQQQYDFIIQRIANNDQGPLISSVPHTIDRLAFAIPLGELYTPLEKMFLMFDDEVWVAIGITISTGLITIQVINCMSVKIQNFVFGSNIKTPTLNMISIFLNGGQLKVPGRNFARFIFILFIIWSLIIRTCYQSILFTLLQADPRKPTVQSIDELVEKGFTLYGNKLSTIPFTK